MDHFYLKAYPDGEVKLKAVEKITHLIHITQYETCYNHNSQNKCLFLRTNLVPTSHRVSTIKRPYFAVVLKIGKWFCSVLIIPCVLRSSNSQQNVWATSRATVRALLSLHAKMAPAEKNLVRCVTQFSRLLGYISIPYFLSIGLNQGVLLWTNCIKTTG
jgi:hypothetical protein